MSSMDNPPTYEQAMGLTDVSSPQSSCPCSTSLIKTAGHDVALLRLQKQQTDLLTDLQQFNPIDTQRTAEWKRQTKAAKQSAQEWEELCEAAGDDSEPDLTKTAQVEETERLARLFDMVNTHISSELQAKLSQDCPSCSQNLHQSLSAASQNNDQIRAYGAMLALKDAKAESDAWEKHWISASTPSRNDFRSQGGMGVSFNGPNSGVQVGIQNSAGRSGVGAGTGGWDGADFGNVGVVSDTGESGNTTAIFGEGNTGVRYNVVHGGVHNLSFGRG